MGLTKCRLNCWENIKCFLYQSKGMKIIKTSRLVFEYKISDKIWALNITRFFWNFSQYDLQIGSLFQSKKVDKKLHNHIYFQKIYRNYLLFSKILLTSAVLLQKLAKLKEKWWSYSMHNFGFINHTQKNMPLFKS